MNNDNFCTSSVCVEVVKVVGSGGGKGVSVLVCIPTSGETVQCMVRGGRWITVCTTTKCWKFQS